ncbi:MAG: class SAM-dependent methyltransferase [Paenibacillaceae bacterium]|nr:class SAM-dependent methyltransferase [Paenibacillaceae bacterium]
MSANQQWQPDLYDAKLDFVSELGHGVVDLLNPQPGENVLDLGCGTGDLTYKIAQTGATVVGMDLSVQMIENATKKYPDLHFIAGNAEKFEFAQSFDAVFSNAALHWMKHPQDVIRCVWNVLKTGGRFVAEFGGRGNVETVIKAISHVLEKDYGIHTALRNPWFFPSLAQYSLLLEQQGFRVVYAVHFDRPTGMKDGDDGLKHWLSGFAGEFFEGLLEKEIRDATEKIKEEIRDELFSDGVWYVDYKRLRVVAIRTPQSGA